VYVCVCVSADDRLRIDGQVLHQCLFFSVQQGAISAQSFVGMLQ